jgi:predicted lipoprotein with Yx(FWY)xxD motif
VLRWVNIALLLSVLVDSQHHEELAMRHPRIIIASLGLAAVAAGSGIVAAASAGGSPAPTSPAASRGPAAGRSTAAAASTSHASARPAASQQAAATVRTAPAAVAGKTETVLVNAQGLPLYFYRPDTATKSFVTGGLARLWPPLTSAAPSGTGVSGKLTVLNDANGHQVAYNGHFLYTFTSDHAGQVTGQGFQDFFVATPGLAPIAGSPAGTVPAAPASGGFGY